MAILEFHQVSLFVGDLEKALRFYRDALGCLELARLEFGPEAALPFGLAPRAIRTVVLARAGMQLELVAWAMAQAGDCPGPSAPGLFHLTFTVDDLASTIHSLGSRSRRQASSSTPEAWRAASSAIPTAFSSACCSTRPASRTRAPDSIRVRTVLVVRRSRRGP